MEILEKLTKTYILSLIKEEEVFEFYTGVAVTFETLVANSFCSPFRKDNTPTCNYYTDSKGKIRFRDWNGIKGDCFDIASIKTGIKINTGLGFNLLLEKIAYDFKIHKFKEEGKEREKFKETYLNYKNNKKKLVFKVVPRKFNKIDELYWFNKHNVSSDLLKKMKVIPIEELYIENKEGYLVKVYTYISNNPGYAYYGGVENNIINWITYFPFEKRKTNKHRRNNSFINGFQCLLPARVCIITKSTKDVLIYKAYGLEAISIPNESYIINKDIIFILKQLFDIVITNFDFDYAGIKLTNKYKKLYKLNHVMLTNGKYNTINYGAKDISDFRYKFGHEKTKNLINKIIQNNIDIFKYYDNYYYNLWNIRDMT